MFHFFLSGYGCHNSYIHLKERCFYVGKFFYHAISKNGASLPVLVNAIVLPTPTSDIPQAGIVHNIYGRFWFVKTSTKIADVGLVIQKIIGAKQIRRVTLVKICLLVKIFEYFFD